MSEMYDWRTFSRHLSVHPINFRIIITGSTAELSLFEDDPQPDLDFMFYYTDVIGVDAFDGIPKGFHGRLIKFTEYLTRPGYVQIQQKDLVFLMTGISQFEFFTYRKGPARKLPDYFQWFTVSSSRNPDVDAVLSILCPGWPTAAIPWTTRSRPRGWPTNDAIDVVVNGGHHLVEKSHPLHTGADILWRISFSKAESYLIESWTREQKDIYYLLRFIKQNVIKTLGSSSQTALCTYHFKTLMLWQCEKRPNEFWMRDNISTAIVTILCEMIVWLIDKNCPNYFIPENNMLDHLPVDHCFSKEIDALSDSLCEECLAPFIMKLNERSGAWRRESPINSNTYLSTFSGYLPNMGNKQTDEIEIIPLEELKLLHMALKLQVELKSSARGLEISGTAVNLEDVTEEALFRAALQNPETSVSINMQRLRVDAGLSYHSILPLNFLLNKKTFLISVIYLANFYYVSKRDYERSRSLCRKVFDFI